MSTTITEFHDELIKIEEIIKSKGLEGAAAGHINWIGDEVEIRLRANEKFDVNGYWSRESGFVERKGEELVLLAKAGAWAYNLPNEEGRAIEFMLQELNKLAEKLPKGHGEIAARAWEEVSGMILAHAESIASHGLPSSTSITNVVAMKEDKAQ